MVALPEFQRIQRVIGALAGLMLATQVLAAAESRAEQAATVDFAREIRPILAQHCWRCHGPDEKSRQAKLRLDQRDSAVSAMAIVPGDPEASALIARIESDDESVQMPPP